MPLRRYLRSLARIVVAGSALAFLASCAKNPVSVDRNRPPRTFLVAAPIDSTISHPTATGVSYSYRIHLYWRGEDSDGYVVGYLWAFDDSSAGHFHYTSKTDSIFEVTVNDSADITRGSSLIGTSRFHTFYVRAVDNLGKPDPGFAAFNRTTYKATTIKPRVKFVGGLPGGIGIDTLSDGEPFSICWTGDDSDGVVVRYKFDVGSVNSSLTTDTCAFFNSPGGIALASGLYNMTVTAVDNAFATGTTNFVFVVNHDPETWFEPKGGPIGYYHPPYLGGNLVDESVVVPFAQGDTVPYRSTVWFNWDGEDVGRPGTPNNPNPERNCLNGFSLELRAGTRNGANAYTIGFIDTIPGNPPRRFKSNEPNYLRQAGFSNFVLDSLDQGFGMIMLAAARDCSNRGDGTRRRSGSAATTDPLSIPWFCKNPYSPFLRSTPGGSSRGTRTMLRTEEPRMLASRWTTRELSSHPISRRIISYGIRTFGRSTRPTHTRSKYGSSTGRDMCLTARWS